jgi:hypothetical protein
MSIGFKANYGLPRFFDGEEEEEKVFWEIADKYLLYLGEEQEQLRDPEVLESLGHELSSDRRHPMQLSFIHRLVFLGGIYQQAYTEEGISTTGVLDLIPIFQGIIKHKGALEITIIPGYPGNITYVFKDEDDQKVFKKVMTQIYQAMADTIPLSGVENNMYTVWRY